MSKPKVWGKTGERLKNKPLLIKYLRRSTIYIDKCWIYVGGSRTNDGYRKIIVDGKLIGIHRLSAYIYLGLDLNDNNLQANHKSECSSKCCWNYEHIYLGTHKQNIQDYLGSGHYNSKKMHCKNGHILTVSTTSEKRQCRICKNEKSRIWHKNIRAKIKARNMKHV